MRVTTGSVEDESDDLPRPCDSHGSVRGRGGGRAVLGAQRMNRWKPALNAFGGRFITTDN